MFVCVCVFIDKCIVCIHVYRWTWIWQTRWDQENWFRYNAKIRRIHMTNTWYALDWDSSISSVICKNPSYSGPSYPSSPVHRYLKYFVIFKMLFYDTMPRESGCFSLTLLQVECSPYSTAYLSPPPDTSWRR